MKRSVTLQSKKHSTNPLNHKATNRIIAARRKYFKNHRITFFFFFLKIGLIYQVVCKCFCKPARTENSHQIHTSFRFSSYMLMNANLPQIHRAEHTHGAAVLRFVPAAQTSVKA